MRRALQEGIIMLAVVVATVVLTLQPLVAPSLATDGLWADLSSPWGTDTAQHGIDGLNFTARTSSPVRIVQAQHNYQGMHLNGAVVISSIESGNGMTLTIQFEKNTVDAGIFHCNSQYDVPVGGAVIISATVASSSCLLGGPCYLKGPIDLIEGNDCR